MDGYKLQQRVWYLIILATGIFLGIIIIVMQLGQLNLLLNWLQEQILMFWNKMEDIQRSNYSLQEKEKVFNMEFLPHNDTLFNFAYRLTYNEDDSKDLVQLTYLNSFRYIDSFQEGTNAKAWLSRILINSFINDFRKKSKEPPKVDFQEIESFYISQEVDKCLTYISKDSRTSISGYITRK